MRIKKNIYGVVILSLLLPAAALAQTTVEQSSSTAAATSAAVVDPTVVQRRVTGTCSVGSFIAAIAEDGSVTCGDGGDARGNTRYGLFALAQNDTGVQNTALGNAALGSNLVGNSNTAVGTNVLSMNTGNANTAVGNNSMLQNTIGKRNTAMGVNALIKNITGTNNTAIGIDALSKNTGGTHNIALGQGAGNQIDGSGNIVIGNPGAKGESRTTRIGQFQSQSRAFIAGIHLIATGAADALTVVIDSNGQLGTVSSSRRYKEEINEMGDASARLLSLNPVTFRYRQAYENGEQPVEYGLIAEEVAQVFPELVVFNENNQPETVKYRLLSSLLLNELQKQNSELRRQESQLQLLSGQVAEIEDLQEQMADLSQLIERMTD